MKVLKFIVKALVTFVVGAVAFYGCLFTAVFAATYFGY